MSQYYLFLGVGLLLLLVASLIFKNSLSFLKNAKKTTGTVISLRTIVSEGEGIFTNLSLSNNGQQDIYI
ncbi:hypothetical protein DRW42_00140 [Pedobacter miscanthi]|uniref:Uncharacterized protein n=1 Tax=Pedobacter miscanthi TaxID=2259170 RepID=A0A366LD00_9SPHI|nr:hypothetical protein DRW42_00140 [Pedobacter miscanthi]